MGTAQVIVFDVNETLSDLAPLARRFADVGLPELNARVWFSSLLRDGFALAAAGAAAPFATIGEGLLRAMLASSEPDRDGDEAVAHIMNGFMDLDVHPDVPDGVRSLAASGRRLVTLTNGSTSVGERLLSKAGLIEHFERLMSVDDAGAWKPAPASYHYAADVCGCAPADMLLVAVHPWDIDGAKRAGLDAAWIDRSGQRYPGYFSPPDHTIGSLGELAGRLA